MTRPKDDHVYKQLDLLTEELGKIMADQVDPRDFGKLEGAVAALKGDVDGMREDLKTLTDTVSSVANQLTEARGGWKMLMMLGGAGATLGSIITYFLTHQVTIGPK